MIIFSGTKQLGSQAGQKPQQAGLAFSCYRQERVVRLLTVAAARGRGRSQWQQHVAEAVLIAARKQRVRNKVDKAPLYNMQYTISST